MKHPSPQTNRRGQKRRIRLFLSLVLFFSIWSGYTVYLQSGVLAEKESELQELEQKVAALRETNAELQYNVNRLHDEEYIAELARKKYALAKPGEILFIVPE